MKNILGTQEDLRLYNKAGNLVYKFTAKSNGSSYEYTYDKFGKVLTFKDSNGFWWERTYDDDGEVLTFKNSNGVKRGFDIPEFTMEQLVEKVGNFKLIK